MADVLQGPATARRGCLNRGEANTPTPDGDGGSGPGAPRAIAWMPDALLAALAVPSGIYNVCRDAERVSNRRFAKAAGWHAVR